MSIRRFAILVVLCCCSATVTAQTVFFFPQIGDGRVGTIQFQTSLIFVNTGGDTTITVDFFATGAGDPLSVTLGSLGRDNSFNIFLAEGASISLQTPGTGGIVVGYARITVPPGGSVGGTGVFTRTHVPTGTILYEAGVPAARDLNDFTLFVDTIGNRDTGLAMVNTETGGAAAGGSNDVRLTLYDLNFNQLATTVVPLAGGAHQARFVAEIFDAVPSVREMEGTVAVSSPDDLAAVTLRQNDAPGVEFPNEVPTLTAFPVVEGSAAAAGLSGSLASAKDGKLVVTVSWPKPAGQPEGALLMFYSDGHLADAEYHAIDSADTATFQTGQDAATFERVEVELIWPTGLSSRRLSIGH